MSESLAGDATIPFDSRLVVPDHVATRRLDDELVLLNYDSETYFGLDDVGTTLWEVLRDAETLDAGVLQLAEVYDVDLDRLRADVAALVRELIDSGLVELHPV